MPTVETVNYDSRQVFRKHLILLLNKAGGCQRLKERSFSMIIRLFIVIAALCVAVFALYFYAMQVTPGTTRYAVFNPFMTSSQTAQVQLQIDEQLIRKPGGRQVGPIQVVYDNGAVVVTFPVPGEHQRSDGICDYGYFCVWENPGFTGRKLSLLSKPDNRPVNLIDYNLNRQVSSWQHNNKNSTVKVFGIDGPSAIGNMTMSNLKEVKLGRGCCPFSIPEKASASGVWTEVYGQDRLAEFNDRMVSVAFSPMFVMFAQ
ncbi:peptidase inhibitor family I36 protein [Pseudomonas sp. LB3P31]